MTDHYDRIPPQDSQTEKALLGSVLIDNKNTDQVFDLITIEMFYKGAHRKIYKVMLDMYGKSEPIDLMTLQSRLDKVGMIEDIGGAYYLTELSEAVPTSANINEYAKIIKEKWFLRKGIELSSDYARLCYDKAEFDEISSKAHQIYNHEHSKNGDASHDDICLKVLDLIDRRSKSKEPDGILSPLYDLNRLTWGFQEAEYWIIAGRPSMGKTAWVLNQFRKNIKLGIPTGFFSLEMSAESLIMRMAIELSGVNANTLRGYGTREDVEKLVQAVSWIQENKKYWMIDETSGASVEHVRSVSRRWVRDHGVRMVMIDYIQLMTGHGENKNIEITNISRGIQGIKQELKINVQAISQLSRKVEERADKRPQLSDLRESGSLEQDADGVLFMYRPAYYMNKDDPSYEIEKNDAEVIIAKQRNGPVGTVHARFFAEKQKFADAQ